MRAAATKAEIQKKALELFSKLSYSKTSVSDIAAACGLGKGTIYLHFKTKDDILFAILEDQIKASHDAAAAYFDLPGVSFEAKLERFFEDLVDEYFSIKGLIFGSFEYVQGSVLKEVFQKCNQYYLGSIEYLDGFAARFSPVSCDGPAERRETMKLLMELVVGRLFLFLIQNDWNDKEGIKRIIAPLAVRLFRTLMKIE